MIASPSGAGARACAPSVRGITIRKIPKVNAVLKRVGKAGRVRAIGTGTGTPESPVRLVLGGGNPELVELIMGLIEADPDKDPKEAQEQAMRGVLSWASLNRANRALFHRTHLKWWPALLTKHAHVADPERLGRSVVPHTTGTAMHARFVQIHDNLVREREEREEREAKAKAEAAAAMAQWEAERGISIRRAQEHADHFENTDQYQRWMFHTSKRDPRELELTKVMQRAERLVDHPKHLGDKSQSKERLEMSRLLSALRTRRREWEVFRTSPKPFVQMTGALTEAVRAMEAAMGIVVAAPPPEPGPQPSQA